MKMKLQYMAFCTFLFNSGHSHVFTIIRLHKMWKSKFRVQTTAFRQIPCLMSANHLLSGCSSFFSCEMRIRFAYLSTQGYLITSSNILSYLAVLNSILYFFQHEFNTIWCFMVMCMYEKDLERFRLSSSGYNKCRNNGANKIRMGFSSHVCNLDTLESSSA